MYEPLNVSIASSFNCIETFKKEIKAIDTAIEREIKGLNPNAFIILQSIDGIGPVFAGGIVAEIGDISAFTSSDALAKYAGLCWKSNQSGDFDGEDTPMTKAGNRYLRYYLGEAANSMRKHNVEYGAYYRKKYNEVPKHQHKRALALTSRKFVRLVYGLLARNIKTCWSIIASITNLTSFYNSFSSFDSSVSVCCTSLGLIAISPYGFRTHTVLFSLYCRFLNNVFSIFFW